MEMLFAILIAVSLLFFWASTLRARETALRASARSCEQMNVQFLDQTVALHRLSLDRNDRGHLLLRRIYRFEFSTNGTDRYEGRTSLLGQRVETVTLNHPEGTTFN